MEQHKINIEKFLTSGGDPKLAARYKAATLENRAKILSLLRDLQKNATVVIVKDTEIKAIPTQPVTTQKESSKPKFLGFISQYPVDLHETYHLAFSLWLEACSLKIQLNAVDIDKQSLSFEIQSKMMRVFSKFDKCKDALDYYLREKRVMPVIAQVKLEDHSEGELFKKRNNLRSTITKKEGTIKNQIERLPPVDHPKYHLRYAMVLRKKEELELLKLDLEKIGSLL